MKFFKKPHIDFVNLKKYSYFLSGFVMLFGLILYAFYWVHNGTPFNLGIEFTGGTEIQLKFNKSVSINEIRKVLSNYGYGKAVIQNYGSRSDEVLIRLKRYEGGQNKVVDTIKSALMSMMQETRPAGKIDLNSINDVKQLTDIVQKHPEFAVKKNDYVSAVNLQNEFKAILNYKENHRGIIKNFSELNEIQGLSEKTIKNIEKYFYLSPIVMRNSTMIGPAVGKNLKDNAVKAIIFSIIAILIYVSWRFDYRFAVASVIALIHDVFITSIVFVLTQRALTLSVIAALLTIFGYSLNDTIVVSDRIRENSKLQHKESYKNIVNASINDTLSRTIVTSFTTFITVLAIFLFGGEVIHDFSLALLIGIVVGTYSSIFVVSPIVYDWHVHSLNESRKRRNDKPEMIKTEVRSTNNNFRKFKAKKHRRR